VDNNKLAAPHVLGSADTCLQTCGNYMHKFVMHSKFHVWGTAEFIDFNNINKEIIMWNDRGIMLCERTNTFLGAFSKLRKAIISFVMLVCPSVRMKLCLGLFRKSVSKIHIPSKSDKNNEYFKWKSKYILAHFFLEWEMFQTKVADKIRTRILCSVTFTRKSCRL
jgi:hypothetical protein